MAPTKKAGAPAAGKTTPRKRTTPAAGANTGRSAPRSRSAAGKNLVIVESPAKARTIAGYLGSDFVVEASFGHVRDLPKSEIGVDVEHGFDPKYVVPSDKSARVKSLKEMVRAAQAVYLATDPDREGEAIAWHVQQVTGAGNGRQPLHRVEFHEITSGAIKRAVASPRSLNLHLVDAQQARRVLDRLVGYKISPLLWSKVRRGTSAGRVQSVAVRLVVEREREIRAFVPEEYWSIEADLGKRPASRKGNAFHAVLHAHAGKKVDLKTGVQADGVMQALQNALYVVESVKTKETQRRPSPPFITSTLQQEASRKLGMGAKKTMQVAQQLYEGIEPFGGLITYMRTDSTNVAAVAQQEAREVIAVRFGKSYVPASPPVYAKKVAGAQEAHEAVRPTSVARDLESVQARLTPDQQKLYGLVWRRFVASQMANAVLDQTSVDVGAGPAGAQAPRPFTFRASGSVIKFQGFLAVYREGRDAGDADDDLDKNALPLLEQGEPVDLLKLWPEQHFTQPPPRFTEPTLVKALEEKGIGRPSTYASILSTIQDREYVVLKEKKFEPTPLGETVNDLLVAQFPRIVDIGFTATMEGELDEIAEGHKAWAPVVAGFYAPLMQALQAAEKILGRMAVQDRKPEPVKTGEMCPESGHELVIRQSKYGPFIACSGYPKCKYTRKIKADAASAPAEAAAPDLAESLGRCPECGKGGVVEKKSHWGKTFYSCNRFPACRYATNVRPAGALPQSQHDERKPA